MAEGLFDNRYRYDFIYPRGRSGETLRAYDIQANDRPVVIKRPAPNDAPPIRAGQEVSIVNERRALSRLAGNPVLTELLGEGQFNVGGVTHQYIVMERAEGVIIADEVLELASRGEYLPELEMLVIIDRLLDLLYAAHTRDIVYNDVDAKHLFWNREQYRLKIIDWGNAVFLEGDDVTPQGISRQSDIYQVGELLYFILTGGGRPDVPRDASEGFMLDFGEARERVSERLQQIVSKAVHPNPKYRYAFVTELRRDLAEYRGPLERERDGMIARISERMRRNLSKNELQNLQVTLENAIAADPGYPPAAQVQAEINERLRDIEVEAGLDAVRIYMDGANWSRAVELLGELREKAGALTSAKVNLLFDCAMLLLDSPAADAENTSPAILNAIDLMFENHITDAARELLTEDTPDAKMRKVQWLLAERISSHVPDALLLRPNLYRLELALATLSNDGYSLKEPRKLIMEVWDTLNELSDSSNPALLRDKYRDVVDRLTALNSLLATLSVQHNLSNRKLPLSSLDRALNAAMALADNMHVIGKQATSSPRDAMAALDSSRAIDPTNSAWDALGMRLDNLYELLQSYQTYVPAADGSDLEAWLKSAQIELAPFSGDLFDEMLMGMVSGLEIAEEAWKTYAAATIRGDRYAAINALAESIDAVGTVSPTLAGWLNQLRTVVDGAKYIERHAIYGGLGRTLADGWQAFDRSRLPDAERLGQHAVEIARNDDERFAAMRLRDVAHYAREWVERNAVESAGRTKETLGRIEGLYTDEENRIRRDFNDQMPSKETYLKAMGKGIVELYGRHSTGATRLLALNYVLFGVLDAHADRIDDTEFWREAAVRALGDDGAQHVIVRTLVDFTERRRDVIRVSKLIDQLNSSKSLGDLEKIRRLVEENPQAKMVAAAVHSLREFELAIRDWSEGEFRAAGLKLENAISAAEDAQKSVPMAVPQYVAWLKELQARAAELHTQARNMRQEIEKRAAEPSTVVRNAHRNIAQVSLAVIGKENANTLMQWNDMYERFLSAYTNNSIRRSQKLEQFNELFHAMFIDRHPAYSLYRYWYDVVDKSPEFPAPPTDDPVPRINEDDDPIMDADIDYLETKYSETKYGDGGDEDEYDFPAYAVEGRRRRFPVWPILIGVVLVVAIGVFALLSSGNGNPSPSAATDSSGIAGIALTITDTPEPETPEPTMTESIALSSTEEDGTAATSEGTPEGSGAAAVDNFVTATLRANEGDAPTDLPAITETPEPTATFTPTETDTPEPPTATYTPSVTPTATLTPTPTLPPEGLQGEQNLLALLSRMNPDDIPWTEEQFFLVSVGSDGEFWRLGTGAQTGGDEIQIVIDRETLDQFYGADAASRIRRVEARISLLTADPILAQEDIYFGLFVLPAEGGDGFFDDRGVHLQVVNLNAINIFQRVNDELTFVRQQSVNSPLGRFRVDRDLNTGVVTTFFNGEQIGPTIQLAQPDTPILPVLYIKDGGVVASVTEWTITLR